MSNLSSAYGTLLFEHPTEKPTLIEKFVQYGLENFHTGVLLFRDQFTDMLDPSDEWVWQWGEIYDFESFGKNTFFNTLEDYFESFEKAPFKDQLVGMNITLDYVDHEPGTEYLVKQHIEMTAILDDDGKIKTKINTSKTENLAYNAANLVQHQCVAWAYDTTTPYGVDQYLSYVDLFVAENPTAFANNPKLSQLLKNKRRILIRNWIKAFKDCGVDVVNDDEDYTNESNIIDVLVKTDVMEHPSIKPYTEKSKRNEMKK